MYFGVGDSIFHRSKTMKKRSLTSTKFTVNTHLGIFKKFPEDVFILFSFDKFAICSLRKKKKCQVKKYYKRHCFMVSSGILVDAILVYQSASSELTLTFSQRNDGQISCFNFIGYLCVFLWGYLCMPSMHLALCLVQSKC